jgi:YHS domain-containing protein
MKVVPTFLARRALVSGLAAAALLTGSAAYGGETTPPLAIKGYDPVSYFTPGKPMPGSAEISYEWDGARWQFADKAHRELFRSNPDAYAPQYGGYCALGMTTGNRGEVNPEVWAIVDGKLYLNYEKSGQDEWRKNQAANIARADQNWAKLKR